MGDSSFFLCCPLSTYFINGPISGGSKAAPCRRPPFLPYFSAFYLYTDRRELTEQAMILLLHCSLRT